MYNTGDFLGKFIPSNFTLNSLKFTYLISLFFPLVCAYYYAYYFFSAEGSLVQSLVIKSVILAVLGLINGYNTNNIFCVAIN